MLEQKDIVMPVTNINIRYKASAKLNDELIIETFISKVTPLSITFTQTVSDKSTNKLFIQATVDVVAINKDSAT